MEKLCQIPITTRVHEQDGTARVYFEPSSKNAKALENMRAGDRVVILATVHEVISSGGYARRQNKEEVIRRASFSLDIGDMMLYSIRRGEKHDANEQQPAADHSTQRSDER